jgi:uncharacterized protein (DUF1778 family)
MVANQRTKSKTRDRAINIRTSEHQRALIDRAAMLTGKSRSDFMVESASLEAERVLLDRTFFALDEDAFARFDEILKAPVQASPELHALMHTKAPWD